MVLIDKMEDEKKIREEVVSVPLRGLWFLSL